jgi:hypothetical protein
MCAQSTFSAAVPHVQRTGTPGSDVVFDVTIRNISTSDITLSFVRRGGTVPAGWESALCVGAACFPSSVDSIALSPAFGLNPLSPGDSCAFSLHVYTTPLAGSGTVRVLIRSGRGDADTLGLQFTASTLQSAVISRDGQAAPGIVLSSYPNPFNPSTTISFSVPSTGRAVLRVYTILAEEAGTLFDGIVEAGRTYSAVFTANAMSSGVYICRLTAGGKTETRRMMMVR